MINTVLGVALTVLAVSGSGTTLAGSSSTVVFVLGEFGLPEEWPPFSRASMLESVRGIFSSFCKA